MRDRRREFGVSLRALRRERRMSQERLALEADVELHQVSDIEQGKISPRLDTVLRIADALGADVRLTENGIETHHNAA